MHNKTTETSTPKPAAEQRGFELELHGGEPGERVWLDYESEKWSNCELVLHLRGRQIIARDWSFWHAVPASRPCEYTLAPGDNLYMVSRRLQVSYNDLMQANELTDPRQLRVGQKLKVPTHIASL